MLQSNDFKGLRQLYKNICRCILVVYFGYTFRNAIFNFYESILYLFISLYNRSTQNISDVCIFIYTRATCIMYAKCTFFGFINEFITENAILFFFSL